MYTYKYYVETDNEVKPVYDLEFTVEYRMDENGIDVLKHELTKVTSISGFVLDMNVIPVTVARLYSQYSKSWNELEAELWSDWDDKQIFD